MAGDWIKMRACLATDPKVMAIAEFLVSNDGTRFSYWITCDQYDTVTVCDVALRHIVTGALHNVWCAANEHAKNGMIAGAKSNWIDSVCGINGFGKAMESVGWAKCSDDGLMFPKFDANNTSGAERQKKYRERMRNKSDVTRDVTRDVTLRPREEKRRLEKIREEKEEERPARKRASPPAHSEEPPDEFPEPLNNERFKGSWNEWVTYRKEIKKQLTETSKKQQLKKMAAMGMLRAVAMIEHTIAMGWQGLREPEQEQRHKRNGFSPTNEIEPVR